MGAAVRSLSPLLGNCPFPVYLPKLRHQLNQLNISASISPAARGCHWHKLHMLARNEMKSPVWFSWHQIVTTMNFGFIIWRVNCLVYVCSLQLTCAARDIDKIKWNIKPSPPFKIQDRCKFDSVCCVAFIKLIIDHATFTDLIKPRVSNNTSYTSTSHGEIMEENKIPAGRGRGRARTRVSSASSESPGPRSVPSSPGPPGEFKCFLLFLESLLTHAFM